MGLVPLCQLVSWRGVVSTPRQVLFEHLQQSWRNEPVTHPLPHLTEQIGLVEHKDVRQRVPVRPWIDRCANYGKYYYVKEASRWVVPKLKAQQHGFGSHAKVKIEMLMQLIV